MNAKGPSCCSTPRRRSGIRVATGRQENRIRDIAARLRDNPAMVLPTCRDDCRRCSFKGIRKKLEKLRDADEETLKKYAAKKDFFSKDLVSAVAATMLLADADDIPYLAAKDINGTTYVYAKRGNADEEKLLAVQNYDDPHLRLLAVVDLAAKDDLYLYSLADDMICVEDDATPPESFVSFVLQRLGLDNGDCTHMPTDQPHIVIDWKPADVTIRICERCTKRNTVAELTRYFYAPDIEEIFSVHVEGDIVECHQACSDCPIEAALDTQLDDEMYLAGQMNDAAFIENWQKKVRWNIEALDQPVFIFNGICFGDNAAAAVEHLQPKPWEESALRLLLEQASQPLILDDATPNAVIAEYWDDMAGQLVQDIAGSEGLRILREGSGKYTPAEILERVHEAARRQQALATLPSYSDLPELASFADGIARAYRSGGPGEAMKAIQQEHMDFKHKAVAYAFLLA
ncbi:MAG: hypothetical protein ACP5FL_09540, partial [Thermoplasmatota archaeon]